VSIPTAVDELSCSQTNRQTDRKTKNNTVVATADRKNVQTNNFNISVNIPQNCKYRQSCCIA